MSYNIPYTTKIIIMKEQLLQNVDTFMLQFLDRARNFLLLF